MRLVWKRPNVSSSRALQPNLLLVVLPVKAPQQALMAGEAAATAADKPMRACLVCPALLAKPRRPTLPLPTRLAAQRIWVRSLTLPMPKHLKRLPVSKHRSLAHKLLRLLRNPKASHSSSSNSNLQRRPSLL
jgi:hypothetical protein